MGGKTVDQKKNRADSGANVWSSTNTKGKGESSKSSAIRDGPCLEVPPSDQVEQKGTFDTGSQDQLRISRRH